MTTKDTAEPIVSVFTPGPWRHKGIGIEAQAFDGSWKWITPVVHGSTATQASANRALMTAAPDLYHAIDNAMEYLEMTIGPCEPGCECVLHPMRAALARVEGRSS